MPYSPSIDSVVHMSYRILMTTTQPVRMMNDAKKILQPTIFQSFSCYLRKDMNSPDRTTRMTRARPNFKSNAV